MARATRFAALETLPKSAFIDPFPIGIAEKPPLSVPGGIEELHRGVCDLVVVVAPIEQYVANGGMDVHVPADARKLVEYPSDIACFRLGERVRPVIRFIDWSIGGEAGCACCRRVKVLPEIPQKIIISVDIDANGGVIAGGGVSGIAVLAPKRIGFLVVANAIGIHQWKEHDSGVQCLDDVSFGVGFGAVSQADGVLLREEQVGNEIDQIIRATALSGVDAGSEIDMVGVVVDGSNHPAFAARSFRSGVRNVERGDAVFVYQSLNRRVYFVDVQYRAEVTVAGIRTCPDTLG